ncbi:transporter [Cellulophaga baltica]|jgi:hypothetical protein|uniref:transporter n=1 Tax=Cellulophaga baltica TaxID=76594 RepID=UPI002494F30E|nr:transporter [Cellulophaga baltica]
MKLKLENKEIELVDVWFNYLYPYLIRFCLIKGIGIEWKNNIIHISKENQKDFSQVLGIALRELLFECYKEPTQKERSKNPSRYQKIEFEGRPYILNYRTDIVGIVGYAIDYLIKETMPH